MINSIRIDRIVNINSVNIHNLEEYFCQMCECIPLDPVICANINCSRYFCNDCISSFNICTFCNQFNFTKVSDDYFNKFKKIKFYCINKTAGCKEELLYETIKDHEKSQCEYSVSKCSRYCNYVCVKADMPKHQERCENVEIKCKHCNFYIIRKNLREHLETCEKSTIHSNINTIKSSISSTICNICNKSIKSYDFEDHKLTCIPNEKNNCSICNKIYSRQEKIDPSSHNCSIELNQKILLEAQRNQDFAEKIGRAHV